MTKIVAKIAEVRKALASAAAVAATIEGFSGTPTNVKADIASALAVLGAFGITWVVSNKQS